MLLWQYGLVSGLYSDGLGVLGVLHALSSVFQIITSLHLTSRHFSQHFDQILVPVLTQKYI